MTRFAIVLAVIASIGTAQAETLYRCDGILTSNNVCIGSESNVDSTDNHAPLAGRTYSTPRNDGLAGQRQPDTDE